MKIICDWKKNTAGPVELRPGFIHLWKVSFDIGANEISRCRSLLSPDELKKADAYRFEKDRTSYTVTRGTLRTLLGRYLGSPPADFKFNYGKYGKPSIGNPSIGFNVSHSGKHALFCFTPGYDCGIDLEEVRPMNDLDGMAKYIMSESEYNFFKQYPPHGLIHLFFNYWTGKESYIKAIGKGLSHHPAKANFVISDDNALRLDMADKDKWFFRSFVPAEGYHASVCVHGDFSGIEFFLV